MLRAVEQVRALQARPRGALALALVAVLFAMPACTPGLGDGSAAHVLLADGLEVAEGDGWALLVTGDVVAPGARVRTGQHEARLQFATGEAWLGPNAAAQVDRESLELLRGEALLSSGGELAARWTDVEIGGQAVYRLAPGMSPRVAVYTGEVTVRRPGEERSIQAFEQIALAARRLPTAASPLSYHPDDAWDRQFLAPAIAFDGEVAQIARGIDRTYTPEPKPASFYRAFPQVDDGLLPLLSASASVRRDDGAFGPPSGPLVTLFVAHAVAAATNRPVAEAADDVLDWRTRGARWGLLASVFEVSPVQFTAMVDLIQPRQVGVASAESPPPVAPAPGPGEAAPPTVTGPPAATAGPPSVGSPPPAAPAPEPAPEEPDEPEPPADNPPEVPLGEPTAEPVVDDVAETIEDVIGGGLGLLLN